MRQQRLALIVMGVCMMCCVAAADARQSLQAPGAGVQVSNAEEPSPKDATTAAPLGPILSAELQEFLARYYKGELPREQLAAAKAAMAATASAAPASFDWADPSWGEYKQLMLVPIDGTPGLPIWGWDAMITEDALNQAALVLQSVLGGLQNDILQRLLRYPGHKVALFKRPEQKATHIPEHHMFPELSEVAGLGGTKFIPVTTCDIQNILETEGDPHWSESVLVHEFAHTIHLVGMSDCEFAAVTTAYDSAKGAGAYNSDMYMISNDVEYWACGAQGWFSASRRDDVNEGIVSRARLWAHDPTLFRLFRYIFKSSAVHRSYPSVCPNCNEKWPTESSVKFSENKAAPLLPLSASGLANCVDVTNRPVPLLPGDCRNDLGTSACQTLLRQNTCQSRRGFAMRTCQNSCFCPFLCTDMLNTCREDALRGLCDSEPDVMSRQCMKSCGLCYQTSFARRVATGGGGFQVRICRDNDMMCYVGANVNGKCTQQSFRRKCPFSCGLC